MGQTPGAYLREWRLTRAAKLLRFSGSTIETISERVGYKSKEAFSRAFRKRFGASPFEIEKHAVSAQNWKADVQAISTNGNFARKAGINLMCSEGLL